MTAAEVLRSARELVANKATWARESYALTRDGYGTEPNNPTAYKFCALGAIAHVERNGIIDNGDRCHTAAEDAMIDSAFALHGIGPAWVNDRASEDEAHAEILAVFDHAIKASS